MKKNTNKKLLVLAILVLITSTFIYIANHRNKTYVPNGADINYSPPTDEEKAAGDRQKESNIQQQDIDNSQHSDSADAKVFITYAGVDENVIEVNAYTNHYEDGTCTITLSKGNEKLSKQTPAYRDASTTICTNPLINKSEVPSTGDWDVQVFFSSTSAKGQSSIQKISIR